MKTLLTLFVLFFSSMVLGEEKNGLFGIRLLWDNYPDKLLKYFDVNLDKDSINNINNIEKLKRIKSHIEKNEFCEKINPIIPNKDYDTYEACLTITSKKIYKIRATGNPVSNEICDLRVKEYDEYFKKTYSNYNDMLILDAFRADLPTGAWYDAPFSFTFYTPLDLHQIYPADFININLWCMENLTSIELFAGNYNKSEDVDFISGFHIIGPEEKQTLIELIDRKLKQTQKSDTSGL